MKAEAVSSRPPPKRLAIFALGAFLLLGLLYPILGPALPRLSEQFGLRATGVSWLLSANSAGAVLGVLLAGFSSARVNSQRRSMGAVTVLALGCVGLAFAPNFGLATLSALLLGLGFGMLDLSLNVWLSVRYGPSSAAALNLLSAAFGVGAVLAPLAVGWAQGNFQLPLLFCAALAALLLVSLVMLPQCALERTGPPGLAQTFTPRSRSLLTLFILLFLAYVAVEGGIGAWEVTHLRDTLSIGTEAAAQLSALFWVSFTLGRLISAPLALRLAPAHLVISSLSLAALSLGLATVPVTAALGYTLSGLFLAPVFTTGLVWLTRAVPTGAGPTLVFAGAFLGPVFSSPVIGALRDAWGPNAIPLSLLGTPCSTWCWPWPCRGEFAPTGLLVGRHRMFREFEASSQGR